MTVGKRGKRFVHQTALHLVLLRSAETVTSSLRCTTRTLHNNRCARYSLVGKQFNQYNKAIQIDFVYFAKIYFQSLFLLFTCCFQEDCNLPRAEFILRRNCAKTFTAARILKLSNGV